MRIRKSVCHAGIFGAWAALLCISLPAFAGGTFEITDEFTADWALRLSTGVAVRAEPRNGDFVGPGNTPGGIGSPGLDDGNLNYNQGDLVSGVARAVGSLNFKYRNYGLFVRGRAWYDHIQNDRNVPHGNALNGYVPNTPLDDDRLVSDAQFSGAGFQEVYVYGTFKPWERPLTVRVGRQTLFWGESMFYRGAIGSINALNLAAFYRPGSSFREFYRPAGMVSATFEPTDNLELNAFYQYEFRRVLLPGCGTFYNYFDGAPAGCSGGSTGGTGTDRQALNAGQFYTRQDNNPDDGGGYGIDVDYTFEDLDATIGAFYLNYRERNPTYSAHKNIGLNQDDSPFNDTEYYYAYPDDVQVIGLTGSKLFAGLGRLSTTLSYLPDFPLGINTSDLGSSVFGSPVPSIEYSSQFAPGEDVPGFRRFDVRRAQVAFDTIVPDLFNADKTTIHFGLAAESIPDLPDPEEGAIRFGRSPYFGVGDVGEDGYVTDFSIGAEFSADAAYSQLLGPVTVVPGISVAQGLDGNASDGSFREDDRVTVPTLGFAYENYSAELSYIHFNSGEYSASVDRDIVAFSAAVEF